MKHPRGLVFRLALFATAFAMVVIILGAFTRLVDAGLGCPDWPGCYGHLTWPSSDHEVTAAERLFPESPVEHDKTWPEMVHRYFAGTLGLLILAVLVICLKHRRELPIRLPTVLFGLVVLQAAFGMWTVTLKLWPQVVTAHLLGGFATLSLLWLLAQRLSVWRWTLPVSAPVGALVGTGRLALVVLILVILQIALGGWTSSNYAAMACPDLPTCHGQWWPKADFAQGFNIFQHVGPNYLGGLLDNHARTAIHLSHRLGAIAVTLGSLLLFWRLWAMGVWPARRLGLILVTTLVIQVGLGLSNIIWILPLPVAVAHNACGALLLLVLVTINHRLRTAAISPASASITEKE
jgi:cytochrome c oxidase assembly protein subunit 15